MTHSVPNKSTLAVQKLMTAFGDAVEKHAPSWPEAIIAATNILIICMRGALTEMDEAPKDEAATAPKDQATAAKVDALLHAFSQQLRELVDLTLAQDEGEAS